MMADPEIVGRELARKIGRRDTYVTPDLFSAVGTFADQHFAIATGRLLSRIAERAGGRAEMG
jgi:hypothetical protein